MTDTGMQNEISRGTITYNESIINGIVALAVTTVEGVAVKNGKRVNAPLKIASK